MSTNRIGKRRRIGAQPVRQPGENDAGYGVRLLLWYQNQQQNGWRLTELPQPTPAQEKALVAAHKFLKEMELICGPLRISGPHSPPAMDQEEWPDTHVPPLNDAEAEVFDKALRSCKPGADYPE